MPTLSTGKIILRSVYDGDLWTLNANDGTVIDANSPFGAVGYPNNIYNTASASLLVGSSGRDGSDPLGDSFGIMDYAFTTVHTQQWGADSLGHGHTLPVGVDASGRFYWANDGRLGSSTTKLRRISAAGSVLDTWTLPHDTISGLAINRAGTVAYYSEDSYSISGTNGIQSPIHRFDLVGGTPLSDLVNEAVANAAYGIDWLVSPAGDLVVPYQQEPWPTIPTLRIYDTLTGALKREISLIYENFDGFDISIRQDLGDVGAVWVWYEYTVAGTDFGSTITFLKFDLTTGVKLKEYDVVNYDPEHPLGDYDTSPRSSQTWWVMSSVESTGGSTEVEGGVIGPLLWVHWPRVVPS